MAQADVGESTSMRFTFEESTHTYRVDNQVVPGCTRVLEFGGLIDYNCVREDILERRSKLGQIVHTACQYFDEGDLEPSSISEDVAGYLESWKKFRARMNFTPRLREYQFVANINGMLVGMKIDAEGFLGKHEGIGEIKITRKIEPSHAIQTAGYALGLPDSGCSSSALAKFHRRVRWAVRLHEDGSLPHLHVFEDKQDAEVFCWALGITHWKMNHGQKLRKVEE